MNEFEKNRMEQALKRKRIRTIFVVAGVFLLAAGISVAGVWFVRSRKTVIHAPVFTYDEVGREHIPLGATPPKLYNSNPPSSGGHFRSPANWGVYDYEVHDQIVIHNLEHGGIWIAYRPTLSQSMVGELKKIADEFGGSKIVMAPRSANDADVAVVSWGRLIKFDMVNGVLSDEQKEDVRAFYQSFKNKGPEFVPDGMPGIDPKSVQ